MSTGEFVAFLDSDDTWRPWHLALLVGALEEFPDVGIAFSDADVVDNAGSLVRAGGIRSLFAGYKRSSVGALYSGVTPLHALGVRTDAPLEGRALYVGDLYASMLLGNLILISSTVVRRSVAAEVGPFDTSLKVGEDYDWLLRATRIARAAYLDLSTASYCVGTPDKLDRAENRLEMARAYLRVIEATITSGVGAPLVPPVRLATAHAFAYRWVSDQELRSGARREARENLIRAFRIRPWQPGIPPRFLASYLPLPVLKTLATLRRAALRGRRGPSRAARRRSESVPMRTTTSRTSTDLT